MASVDVPVALLGYGTVGAAVNRLLNEQADDIERATGHRLRVVKALVRSTDKERAFPVGGDVLTTDIRAVLDDPRIAIVAEVPLSRLRHAVAPYPSRSEIWLKLLERYESDG